LKSVGPVGYAVYDPPKEKFMRYTRRFVTTATLFASIAIVGAQDRGGKKGGGFQLPPMIHIQIADFADGGRIPKQVHVRG
jgi:hypothetical protein